MSGNIIEFQDVQKLYDEKIAVDNLNLEIKDGEFLTIIGSSGSGKTTILKMINGLVVPSKGSIKVNGQNLNDSDMIKLRRSIGYVIQNNGLFPHMSVERNITYVPNLSSKLSKDESRQLAEKMLKIVDLDDSYLKSYPNELSGGQQQRVGIARALAANPKVILMDEPFGAVDEITRKQLQEEIVKIHQRIKGTIVFVTHDINEALKLGTMVLVMNEGKLIQYATPREIIDNPANDFVKELIVDVK